MLTSKLPHVGSSIFTEMSLLAKKHHAINLAQGFPDFETHRELAALLGKYAMYDFNQYAPMIGLAELREKIAEKIIKSYNIHVNPDTEITVTAGATQAIFTVIATLVKPGDEVLIFEPAYDSYQPVIELFGGKTVPVKLFFPDYAIDWNTVREKMSENTRLIIVNNPNNPTTKILRSEDLNELAEIVKDKDIYILSDDVYENIVYDDRIYHPVFSHPDLKEKTFSVASFGKLFHMTGWKTGYCFAPESLTHEFRKIHQFNVFSVHTPTQYALAEFLEEERHYLNLSAFFQQKRDFFTDGLKDTGFEIAPCESTYFITVKYADTTCPSSRAYARWLTENHKVAAIPVSAFHHDGFDEQTLRFCFAKKEDTLKKALEVLQKI